MKRIFTLVFILLSSTILLFGQEKFKKDPLIIQVQITNCSEKYLQIYFRDINGDRIIDTLNLDESGKFYLKTFKVKFPQRSSIHQNNIQINDILIAPGYNLTITGNGKDLLSLLQTKKITGTGSESNRYPIVLDSILIARMDTRDIKQLNEIDFLSYMKYDQRLKDSMAHVIFDRKPIQDKYLKHFGSMVRLDNKFTKLTMLVNHVNWNNYNYEKSVAILRNNFDHNILDNLYSDEYLNSDVYKNSLIRAEYLNYLINLDYKKDSIQHLELGYKLEKVNEVYGGKVKEFVLYNLMASSIAHCKSFESINGYKEQFKSYISNLKNPYYKKSLQFKFVGKEAELLRTQVGKPAPKFILASNLGKTYSLEDFKGKVVYLDLWASWCKPCRGETPSFKILYDKFRNDNRIVFLSIAVNDRIKEWKKAIQDDKPEWIQLIDKEGIVDKSYVANLIPQFVLIDKKGNIVNFNAPRPSSGEEIEKLLQQEIVK